MVRETFWFLNMIRENFQKSEHAQGNFSYLGMRRENFLTLKQPNLGNFCSQYSCQSAILNEDHATQYMLKVLSFRYCVIIVNILWEWMMIDLNRQILRIQM